MEQAYIDVSELLEHPGAELGVSGEVRLDHTKLGEETVEFARPFRFSLKLTNVSEGLMIEGTTAGEVVLRCARCLEKIDIAIAVDFSELAVVGETGVEDNFPIEAGKIDLAPIIFQNIMVEIPMRPLCRSDCAGLCVECGKNLNEEPHAHEKDTVDERLAPLKEYFRKMR